MALDAYKGLPHIINGVEFKKHQETIFSEINVQQSTNQ